MDLTESNKAIIERKSYYELLERWRFGISGDPWLQGETGTYWARRMAELKAKDPSGAVSDSKALGWNR